MPQQQEDITGGNALLARVYAATTPSDSRAAYEEWATTYDADMVKEEYIAPALCAKAIAEHGNITGTHHHKSSFQLITRDKVQNSRAWKEMDGGE